MGRREEYLEADSHWDQRLSRDDRLNRWWSAASFGVALSGKASRAVGAAERAVAVAEAVREMVLHQAVYALLDEGKSVREIAAYLRISKSKAGRMVKSLTRDGSIADLAFLTGPGMMDETRDLLLEAWRFPDLNSSIADHPRGTPEPAPSRERTNFGGLAS